MSGQINDEMYQCLDLDNFFKYKFYVSDQSRKGSFNVYSVIYQFNIYNFLGQQFSSRKSNYGFLSL